ncbi:unnamed protein product [Amaranthus hypochondriacus]
MRGGRHSRGRGGRGRGEELRDLTAITRSGFGKSCSRAGETDLEEDLQSPNNYETVANPGAIKPQKLNSEQEMEDKGPVESEILMDLKQQVKELQQQLGKIAIPNSVTEAMSKSEQNQNEEAEKAENFPALTNKSIPVAPPPQLTLWKDKVKASSSNSGMPLKYVAPVYENGNQVVHIDSHDAVDLIKLWERAVVVYVVGGNVSIETIRGYIRKHWTHVSMPTIHSHEEGYFILRFNTDNECEEILKGGPYFLNRTPMVVKKWNCKFDFKEEVMRVIPVWVRLPNLPLHCWGEDTLSRIVSAIGVPILADECTAKQIKVSYARVLVEVDITKEFVKDIRVRDNMGREFCQKAIPEWKPFFCRSCNKIGHDCQMKTQEPVNQPNKEEGNGKEGKKMWIPVSIARAMQGVTSIADLRKRLTEETDFDLNLHRVHTHGNNETRQICEQVPAGTFHEIQQLETQQNGKQAAVSKQNAEAADLHDADPVHSSLHSTEGWTPVLSKNARRKQQQCTKGSESSQASHDISGDIEAAAHKNQHWDGNPPIPSSP